MTHSRISRYFIKFVIIALLTTVLFSIALPSFADEIVDDKSEAVEVTEGEGTVEDSTKAKAIAAGAVVAVVATAAAIAMGMSVCKASESIARQPEADGKIRSAMMLGLVFIETVVIYALIVAILIIFVL